MPAPDLSLHPYGPFLHKVLTPSRYVGGEFGSDPRPADPSRTRLVLAFPDVYEVGMSHLGTQILYHLVNREPDLAAERAFAPWADLEGEIRARGLPLVSLESWTPLREFDVVGMSLQHELCYTNALNLLELAAIPLTTAERSDADPIVLGGGPCATHPEPMAPFFDAFFVGEAEAHLPALLRTVGAMRRAGAPRGEVLRAMAAMPGVYVPSLYRAEPDEASGWWVPRPIDGAPAVVRRVFPESLDDFPPPVKSVVPWNRAVFDRISVEVARGCSEGCRFCEAGYTYRPLRDRSPAKVLADTLATVAACGHDEVSLGALSPADYPALAPLVHALSGTLTPEGVTLSVSSLRAYGLSESVLKDLRAVRAAGLTLAPEAGTQRLRDVINKNITDEDILEAARRAFGGGWQRLKLYFMLGLPTETDEDVTALVDLARRVLRLGRGMGRAAVNASVGVFVPRPHTPFQWEGMTDATTVAKRQFLLRDTAKRTGVSVKHPDGRTSRMECVMARGDRRLAGVILRAFRKGARFDNWDDVVRHEAWEQAFAEEGVDPETFLRAVPAGSGVPWDVIDPGVSRAFLLRERERAFAAKPLAPCEKPAPRAGVRPGPDELAAAKRVVCYRCGAGCDPHALAAVRGDVVREGGTLPEPRPLPLPESFVQWHLVFTKVGRAAWLSQKDLVKHLPRILRRAGLRPAMSGGYHPMPKLTYREPMPLGYQGVGEWMDAWLDRPPDLDALNAASVDGMVFVAAREAVTKRFAQGEFRYAFASPFDLEATAERLAPLPVVPLDPAELPVRPSPDALAAGTPCVMTWIRTGRPPGRAHEVLTNALGREYVPSELVRLYDDPRARPAGDEAEVEAPLDEVEVRSPDPLPEG